MTIFLRRPEGRPEIDAPDPRDVADVLCYDTETSDTDVRNGQIFQFAAIAADRDLNPVLEHDLRIRRLPYVVPACKALEVTGIDPSSLDDSSLPSEYEASAQIERIMTPVGAAARVYLTFNGIRFDDELLRTTMFRNLRNPWLTSGQGSVRVDVMWLARLAAALAPGSISVPVREETGAAEWRLLSLSRANGIPINAHDGLGDARATLALAALVRRNAPEAWRIAVSCGSARRVGPALESARRGGSVVYLFSQGTTGHALPLLLLGEGVNGRWLAADLSRDTMPQSVADKLKVGADTPYRVVRANAAPFLLSAEAGEALCRTPAPAVAAMRDRWLAAPDVAAEARDSFARTAFEQHERPTSEEMIYDGFPGYADKGTARRFHAAPDWTARAALQFDDRRLTDFAARLVLINTSPGRLKRLDRNARSLLEKACQAAFNRPYASADSRWASLARERDGADAAWTDWSASAFDLPAQGDLFGFR